MFWSNRPLCPEKGKMQNKKKMRHNGTTEKRQ